MSAKLKVNLLRYTPDAEKLIASAAKLCYSPVGVDKIEDKLTDENTNKFLDMLMSMGHESPIEHVSFTFAVEGVSRVLTHQLVRHRIGCSYSQQSQRYVKLDQFEYIIPPAIECIPKAKEKFINAMEEDQKTYNELTNILFESHYDTYIEDGCSHKEAKRLAEKKAIEDARYIFPNACETKIVFTMNARALFNFFKHRCCNRAQWEIRELATEMLKQVKSIAPTLFKYSGPNCLNNPCPEGNMTCGKIKEVREKFSRL
ncbi:FAD-dependent thymidylate synthase [Paramaledivibacter caminithermalis]|jgi:thymidylate synthase (FAD)|uniref:Flavin-dependent thymidylate synthase n=1 Tax=Paramaledivibacter caminithermalis (strain DSM 15212 / CIP 107654 / DViRD3) TaxID=1121301 RepID=A0A1M6Q1J0_PARC5|nr:FAD-dependent thymidylate synthase [Paramaledivibacter caminithermalis]SHK14033.1 thymidylate synthase (FAD) [Paramaledivibacter caminithermalis DSM 15212]